MSLHSMVIQRAAVTPDSPAVVDASGPTSYGELNRHAAVLAERLRTVGVSHGDRVLLWADKSAMVIAAMQAVLRLGAAYVPADGATPIRRVASMARDCAARVVLTTSSRMPQALAELEPQARCLDLHAEPAIQELEGAADLDVDIAEDDRAFILYTSGSTGQPKGVCLSHRNARAFVDWAVEELEAGPGDTFSNHAPLTFDLSVLDIYGAFAVGASVHLIPAELAYAPEQLTDFLHRTGTSIWYSVPSVLGMMMRDGGLLARPAPPRLRAVLFAGEPMPIGQVRDLANWTDARLLNLYGPTETNVCTFHEVDHADLERDRPVPIGAAASGDHVWAERPDGGRAEPGQEGELLVEGPTVMLGYWGAEPQRGPYRTGDIVEVLADGSFDYRGRRDHMVKVRGHRVELGEVESAFAEHPDVAEAVAVVAGEGAEARLIAFVLPQPDRQPGPLALREYAAQRLPRYMLPERTEFVAELPRTDHGKVDRKLLAERLDTVQASRS